MGGDGDRLVGALLGQLALHARAEPSAAAVAQRLVERGLEVDRHAAARRRQRELAARHADVQVAPARLDGPALEALAGRVHREAADVDAADADARREPVLAPVVVRDGSRDRDPEQGDDEQDSDDQSAIGTGQGHAAVLDQDRQTSAEIHSRRSPASSLPSLTVQRTAAAVHKNWVLALCCLAQFMVILDVSVVNVALPSIRADLGFSAVDLQWVVSAYTLTFAGFLLLGGRAADLLGHRTVFIAGLLLFALASLAGGLATSQGMLVVARAVQGLGGAIVAPVTLSVLTTTFTEGGERDRALGLWGAMGGVGGAAGGLVGGALTQYAGWQWVLFINVPIGIGAALAAARLLRGASFTPRGERHYDVAGALTVTAGLVLLTFAIVRTDVNGWVSAATLGVGAAGLALLGLFVFIEARVARRPLVPLRIFSLAHADGREHRRVLPRVAACSPCGTSSRSTCRRCSASARSRPASPSCR